MFYQYEVTIISLECKTHGLIFDNKPWALRSRYNGSDDRARVFLRLLKQC